MVGIGSGSGQRSKADAAVHDAVDYSAERVMCGPRHWQLERNAAPCLRERPEQLGDGLVIKGMSAIGKGISGATGSF